MRYQPTARQRFFIRHRNAKPFHAMLAALVLLAAYGAIIIRLAFQSDSTYMDDELTHYLFARSGSKSITSLLNVWGRPGFTILFMPAANVGNMAGGFRATRLMTVLVMLLVSFLTWRTARLIRVPLAWLAPGLLLLAPMWVSLSYTPTTEAAAALYSIAGTWQLARGNRRWAAVFFALLPITRHEMIVLLIPVALYFLWRSDLVAILLLAWAEGAWNLCSAIAGLRLPFMRFFEKLPQQNYGTGDAVHYFNRWMELFSVSGVGMVLCGCAVIAIHDLPRVRRLLRQTASGRRARLRVFIAAAGVGLVLLNGILYHFNSFASGGYARFLTPAVPWMAITSLYGIALLLRNPHWYSRLTLLLVAGVIAGSIYSAGYIYVDFSLRWVAIGAVVAAVGTHSRWSSAVVCGLLASIAILQSLDTVHPYKMTEQQKLLGRTLDELRTQYPGVRIAGASPWIQYFQNELMTAAELGGDWHWEHNDPPGVLYVYDMSHAANYKPFDWFTRFPYELVGVYSLPENFETPYLRVLRRTEKWSTERPIWTPNLEFPRINEPG